MRKVSHLVVALVLFGLLLAGVGLLSDSSLVGPNPAWGQEKGNHPHIRRAVGALSKARAELKEAAHEFGGHRKEALRAVDHAINQLETCLKY